MNLTINGTQYKLVPEPFESLSTTLRDRLFLAGTKVACERGECGACTVLLDGAPVYSCLVLTSACENRGVTTIEGLAPVGQLHPLQQAFIEHDAVQCGFCTPGQIVAAVALLQANPSPTDDDIKRAMSGNLCRCGTYPNIVKAIHATARALRASGIPEAP